MRQCRPDMVASICGSRQTERIRIDVGRSGPRLDLLHFRESQHFPFRMDQLLRTSRPLFRGCGFVVLWLSLLGVGGAVPANAAAADLPLHIDIDASSFQSRTNGPLPLRLVLNWDSPKLLRGSLRLDFDAEEQHLATYTLENLVLNTGKQETTLLVTPMVVPSYAGEANVRFTFFGPDGPTLLPPAIVRLPGTTRRTFLLGTVESPARRSQDAADSRWLALETYDRKRSDTEGLRPTFQTLLGRLPPDRFPADPNLLTPYDVLCVPALGLKDLDSAQTEAFLAWIQAGGSGLIQLDDSTPLKPHHLDLLNGLAGRTLFFVGTDGKLVREEEPPEFECREFACGWGRGSVLIGPFPDPATVRDEESLRRMIASTWRMSASDSPAFVQSGQLRTLADQELQTYSDAFSGRLPWQVPQGFLFPPTIRPVPGWLLATILAGFVVLIGPADYFLLGAIRRHKWTWILLPVLTFGVTRLVIATSNHYLGNTSRLSTIQVRDLVAGNRVVRTNRFDFHVPGERGSFTLAPRGGQVTPFVAQTQEEIQMGNWQTRGLQRRGRGWVQVAPTSNLPAPQSVTPQIAVNRSQRMLTVPVERWTPVVFRSMEIHPVATAAPGTSSFDWDGIGHRYRTDGPYAVTTAVRAAFGPQAGVECFSRSLTLLSDVSPDPELQQVNGRALGGLLPKSPVLRRHFDESSPSGSPKFEDLELFEDQRGMEPTSRDPSVILQVTTREKEGIVVYRRRYPRAEFFGASADSPSSPSL